jgi:acetyl esterase/lipase
MGYDGKVASAAVDAYLADEGLASSFAVTYNNADKTMASNVLSVNITGWPGAAAADLSIAGLDYMAGYDDEYIAPNWWIRSDAEASKGNPTFLDLADQLKGDAETVNCKLVWDGSPDVNGFFDFAHYVLAYTEERSGADHPSQALYVGLKDEPNGDRQQAIPGISPAAYYDHYDPLTVDVPFIVRADIPYVAYESVPVPYETQTGFHNGEQDGYYQRLDIYRKKGTEGEIQPVLIYVHGGANVMGDKAGPTSFGFQRDNPALDQIGIRSGMNFGYTVVEINYRLQAGGMGRQGVPIPGRPGITDRFPAPAAFIDVRAAIRWLKDNADMLGINPEQIVLAGASAGGEQIIKVALQGSDPANFNTYNAQLDVLGAAAVNDNLCAVLDFFGTGVTGATGGVSYVHSYAPPFYIVNGERDSITNWRTNTLVLYNALVAAGNANVRFDLIEGANHEIRIPGMTYHFADVFNVGTMYKWLYELGLGNVPVTIQGPENIALSYPAFAENEVSVDVLGDLEAESTGFEIYSATVANPVPRFTAKIAGEITGADNVFAGDAFDEFEAVLNADGTPVSRFSYATITNMDEILAAAGINVNRANQTFTVRQTNPALNFAYGAGTFLNNQQTKTYKLADLSEIAEFRILLMNGSSTVTLEVFEGGNASGNARFSIVISSNIAVYSPITSIKISDENGAAAPAMMSAPRNSILQLGVNLNDGATGSGLLWTVSDTSFAVVDASGNVAILNKMGMVVLSAQDPGSGITHAIVLRIT